MGKVKGRGVKAMWIDPRDGKTVEISKVARTGTQDFSTPAGWEDALLVIEAD
jgi:hypothetical protein